MLKAYERIHPMTLERCRAPDHPCIQEIQTTIAYVHMHNCDTQIIASDLCGVNCFSCASSRHTGDDNSFPVY